MNKRKLLLVALSLCMVAILAMGGTLAYLTDTDQETNVFTVGNVDIELHENFVENSKLMPVTYNEDGTRKDDNVVNKDVWVKNAGTENAYVRVHIAIPTILDNGSPDFDAGKNVLHFNADKESYQNGFWNWSTTPAGNDNLADNAMVDGAWNFYTIKDSITVNGVEKEISYNVYVVTYEGELPANAYTIGYAMSQVYLDSKVSSADMAALQVELGANWNILVKAEGAQSAGFANAFDALNTSFGVPSSTNNPWVGYTTDDVTALPAN